MLYAMNAIAIWPWVCRLSKNIILDAFIFDLILVGGFYLIVIGMGAAESFNRWQWLGVAISLFGIITLKYATFKAGA